MKKTRYHKTILDDRKCEICKKMFPPTTKWNMYCSDKCKGVAKRMREKERIADVEKGYGSTNRKKKEDRGKSGLPKELLVRGKITYSGYGDRIQEQRRIDGKRN